MEYPEIMQFEANPALEGMAELLPDIVYSRAGSEELKLTLIAPWRAENDAVRRPLVVFIQGSAWTTPNINYEIPQLAELARAGYVVATIDHRSSLNGHAFPAYLADTKTAIRFLRANAYLYGIDPARVCVYGTSSGGNTALLVGLTGDDAEFKSDEYAEYSDAVNCVVECFGPSDLTALVADSSEPNEEYTRIFEGLAGGSDMDDVLRRMSPMRRLRAGAKYPPFLIVHGDADELVPYEQGLLMYRALIDHGADARMIRVSGAPHEGAFWSRALVDEIYAFIKQHV
ncbi:MAG: prolyl oligopeptidase family serine peptidase [Christensenellales bacterium]|jgi:acetyl esterase/lipase